MLVFIITLIVIGLIAGFVARALVPGDDSMSIPATIALGIVGSFVGGFLASLIGRGDGSYLNAVGIIGSVIGAVVALLVYNAVTGKKRRIRA